MKSIPSGLDEELLDLLRKGEKLNAVKLYKDTTGIGLRESKNYVDQLAKANGMASLKGRGSCFIATACYGNYDALEVLELRQFRDEKLLKSNIGKMFVGFYYFVSPPLATLISKSNILKSWTRKYFLEPIVTRLRQRTKDDN